MIFKKGDKATITGEKYHCIIADEEYAVLGKLQGGMVNFENTVIYANQDNFKETVIGLESINGEAQL